MNPNNYAHESHFVVVCCLLILVRFTHIPLSHTYCVFVCLKQSPAEGRQHITCENNHWDKVQSIYYIPIRRHQISQKQPQNRYWLFRADCSWLIQVEIWLLKHLIYYSNIQYINYMWKQLSFAILKKAVLLFLQLQRFENVDSLWIKLSLSKNTNVYKDVCEANLHDIYSYTKFCKINLHTRKTGW